jgi:hypothetical protein
MHETSHIQVLMSHFAEYSNKWAATVTTMHACVWCGSHIFYSFLMISSSSDKASNLSLYCDGTVTQHEACGAM